MGRGRKGSTTARSERDVSATLLFIFVGLLLMVSGLLKVRGAVRTGLGTPLIPLLEVLAGLGLPVFVFAQPPSEALGLRLMVGAVALLLVSSTYHALRVRAHRRRREESEASRLVTYVKYLSERSEPPSEGS